MEHYFYLNFPFRHLLAALLHSVLVSGLEQNDNILKNHNPGPPYRKNRNPDPQAGLRLQNKYLIF